MVLGDLAENCGVALRRVGIDCDHGATRVAFEDREYRLRTDAQFPTNEAILGEPGCGCEVHENIRPEAPLVEVVDPQLLAEPASGLDREQRDRTTIRPAYKWELYNLTEDFSQNNDLASKMPDKLKELQQLFLQEAGKYSVLPLDSTTNQRMVTPRPSATAGQTVFTYSGVFAGIPLGNAPSILNRSFTITAEVEVPQGGGNGMLVTEGGLFGGYGLYVLKGKPVFSYNMLSLQQVRLAGKQALTPGKHTIVFDFKYDGPGVGKGGTGVLKADGKTIDTQKFANTVPFLFTFDETFDVGLDTRTPVNDKDYQVPFRFTGKITELTFKLGPVQMTSADQKLIQHALAKARD